LIPKDIRVQYKVTRTWDQEYLKGIRDDIGNFPFKSTFVEDTRASKKLKDNDPNTWEVIERGLVTKINERPYISFIDPLKTGEEE
jgi:nanoRNase/pAp phosphatase (c-di-AMP/oligoRNAs hydrolase)